MDEEYWRRYRRRARQRAAAAILLIIAPIGIVVAVLYLFGPTDHPPGDLRDRIEVRLIVVGLQVACELFLIIGSIRLLRRNSGDDGG